jgi:hypothetical protein
MMSSDWSSFPVQQVLVENWKKYLEQPTPSANLNEAAEEQYPADDLLVIANTLANLAGKAGQDIGQQQRAKIVEEFYTMLQGEGFVVKEAVVSDADASEALMFGKPLPFVLPSDSLSMTLIVHLYNALRPGYTHFMKMLARAGFSIESLQELDSTITAQNAGTQQAQGEQAPSLDDLLATTTLEEFGKIYTQMIEAGDRDFYSWDDIMTRTAAVMGSTPEVLGSTAGDSPVEWVSRFDDSEAKSRNKFIELVKTKFPAAGEPAEPEAAAEEPGLKNTPEKHIRSAINPIINFGGLKFDKESILQNIAAKLAALPSHHKQRFEAEQLPIINQILDNIEKILKGDFTNLVRENKLDLETIILEEFKRVLNEKK